MPSWIFFFWCWGQAPVPQLCLGCSVGLGLAQPLCLQVNNLTFVIPELTANDDSAEHWPALNLQNLLPKSCYLLCWAWCVISARLQGLPGLGVRFSAKGGGHVSNLLNLLQILLCKSSPPQALSPLTAKFSHFAERLLH